MMPQNKILSHVFPTICEEASKPLFSTEIKIPRILCLLTYFQNLIKLLNIYCFISQPSIRYIFETVSRFNPLVS